jgi:predicted DNA-binding protein
MTGRLVGVMRPNVVIPIRGVAGRNSTEEDKVSDTTERGGTNVKTLAIRLDEAIHAQLSVIAGLRKSTITEEIRQAIEEHIDKVRSNPELANSAESALDDIEREIATRKAAITALFGESEPAATPARKTGRGSASEGRSGEGATKGE